MFETLNKIIFGLYDLPTYLGAQIIAFLGYIIAFFVSYFFSSSSSKWSWKIFHNGKNIQMLVLLLLLSWVLLRFNDDSIMAINKLTNNDYAFLQDFWSWFLLMGFAIRFVLWKVKKIMTKQGWIKSKVLK